MSIEVEVRQALAEALKTRGTQAKLATELGVTATTVMRWAAGGEIPPPMLKLLGWYFFSIVPPQSSEAAIDLKHVLEFDDAEWRMITIMATRDGNKTPGEWIASRIRDIVALHLSLESPAKPSIVRYPAGRPNVLKVAEEPGM